MFYNYGYYYDPTFVLLIPAMIFALYAQSKVSSTFNKYLKVGNMRGYTGYEVARKILDSNGLYDIPIEIVNGRLTDHYDPRHRVLRLSHEVYNGSSVASIGVAAHECGHAIQHQNEYLPLKLRNSIAPIASFGSQAAWLLFFIGFAINALGLIDLGILLFTAAVLFQIITLPVEFNASNRAIELLESYAIVTNDEIVPARKVLNAAALTYVAAAVTAVLQLVRLLLLRGRRD
jgi:Zn-dependent membrane protease YugP